MVLRTEPRISRVLDKLYITDIEPNPLETVESILLEHDASRCILQTAFTFQRHLNVVPVQTVPTAYPEGFQQQPLISYGFRGWKDQGQSVIKCLDPANSYLLVIHSMASRDV